MNCGAIVLPKTCIFLWDSALAGDWAGLEYGCYEKYHTVRGVAIPVILMVGNSPCLILFHIVRSAVSSNAADCVAQRRLIT